MAVEKGGVSKKSLETGVVENLISFTNIRLRREFDFIDEYTFTIANNNKTQVLCLGSHAWDTCI